METVKVDVRRLQVLNDRINQTIDALSQLRQTVHGFQPSAGIPYGVGLQHSAPTGATPYGALIPNGLSASAQLYGAQPYGAQPYGAPMQAYGFQSPVASPWGVMSGLSHTGLPMQEASVWQLAPDPLLGRRLAQTFPFAFQPAAPISVF